MATIHDPWPKRSQPNGHPADGMTLGVPVGDGAMMEIVDPRSYGSEARSIVHGLTWGDPSALRHAAAGLIESYDYLLSADIDEAEAIRRLRMLRKTRAEALRIGAPPPLPTPRGRSMGESKTFARLRLGAHQLAILREAASEVASACPWLPIYRDRRPVRSLTQRGLLGSTEDLFGIMPAGCWHLRVYDRALAREALAGLRRNRDAGEVMPWHV